MASPTKISSPPFPGSSRYRNARSPPFPTFDSTSSGMGASTSSFASLPPSHFLARSQVSLALPDDLRQPSARPDTTTLASADFDVDVRSGFLPPSEPLSRLPPGPWTIWEEAWEATDGIRVGQTEALSAKSASWRNFIRQMPIVHADALGGRVEALRRAHAVLALLTHFWVHTSAKVEGEETVVLAALAIPFCEVSNMLDMPPILTYSDTVLYNWRLKDPAMGFVESNVEMPLTFTRTLSEVHFYRISLLVETLGPACLSLMRASLDEAFVADALSARRITDNLLGLAALIDRLQVVLSRMREACDPRMFFWEIRPWFNGGSWVMEGVSPRKGDKVSRGGWRVSELGGPSAGQSTLIHALDVFLGVDHRPRPSEGAPAAQNGDGTAPESPKPAQEETFMMRMADYMPHHHRRFLRHLSATMQSESTATSFPHLPAPTTSVRSLAMASPPGSPPRTAYDLAIAALENLRKNHSRMALFYIVSQSRVEPPEGSAFWRQWRDKMDAEWERQEARRVGGTYGDDGEGMPAEQREEQRGTGGTDLAKFLKRCRERTNEALLGGSSTP